MLFPSVVLNLLQRQFSTFSQSFQIHQFQVKSGGHSRFQLLKYHDLLLHHELPFHQNERSCCIIYKSKSIQKVPQEQDYLVNGKLSRATPRYLIIQSVRNLDSNKFKMKKTSLNQWGQFGSLLISLHSMVCLKLAVRGLHQEFSFSPNSLVCCTDSTMIQ